MSGDGRTGRGFVAGADILFAEECLRRGAQLRLLLAQEVDDFARDSVQKAGSDWVRRFHVLREKAEVAVQPERLGKAPNDVSIYARANLWMVNTAQVEAAESAKIHALLVWDERSHESRGGTDDLAQLVRSQAGFVEVVNPFLDG